MTTTIQGKRERERGRERDKKDPPNKNTNERGKGRKGRDREGTHCGCRQNCACVPMRSTACGCLWVTWMYAPLPVRTSAHA
eukprot:5440399-Pyramimonas_sp.AAC.1